MLSTHRQLDIGAPTWRDEFSEDDIRETLAMAGLTTWTFDIWTDGQITVSPPDGTCTKTELDALAFAFGASGVYVESVMNLDNDGNFSCSGLRIQLRFAARAASICVFCTRSHSECRCTPY